MRAKPANADFYAWNSFEKFADECGWGDECDDDWMPAWELWKAGYCVAANGK